MNDGVYPDLLITDVDVQGDSIVLDVIGGPLNCCGHVTLPEPERAHRHALLYRCLQWKDHSDLVDVIIDRGQTILISHRIPASL